ncbi:DUF305 domain-containing protein [Frondihabitans sp. Leaf304]|uniref:DUF305 domain-containing protein n=1 Tax=Frondihabitans sp. Leaf304 TaxID=1736329 RepID=UPI0006FF5541|nr:DUF305 domain-containing protein [Frondihabitans sp. Leaf304]KQQ28636.1 hypothetical protein ASF54_08295 [Frondihabitans sp. Leaf304]
MNRTKTLLVSSTVLAATLALAGCSASSSSGSGMSGMGHSSSAAASDSFNDQDVTFAQMMLPHHKQAVEMSDMLLAKGSSVNADVVALAEKIKAEQSPEIIKLSGWLKDWNQSSAGMSGSMSGMMSDGDMAALDKASGADGGKLFLTQMMQHHTGAITMAKTEVTKGKNADAVALAKSIVSSQSAEITQMKDLLASL